MKFDYQKLVTNKQTLDEFELLSFEMNIYLVRLRIGEQQGMLFNGSSLMRFHSTQQVRDAFCDFHVERAVMVHDSPYEEMIGNPAKADQSFKLPFSLQQPY